MAATDSLDEKKEEKRGVGFSDDDDGPDDDFVGPGDGDSEQENANAEFERHGGQDVDGFTCPPPLRTRLAPTLVLPMRTNYLQTHWEHRLWDISNMLASPVMHARDGKCTVEYEENLASLVSHRKTIAMVPNATNKPTVARSSGPRPAGATGMVNRDSSRGSIRPLRRALVRSASCDFDEDEGEELGSGHT
ncbi:hypothetical protein V499_00317 [Pseudogymnoascus sp. VKM F-103]|nr:hypothetical protein V499_00317 [Pseudogymnoascus sp. VKM F-103]